VEHLRARILGTNRAWPNVWPSMSSILIIDDEPLFLESLELTLQALGHDVFSASSASEAFALMAEKPPDVVVSDILMPTSDGLEVLRKIKECWPSLPVIVMSGGGKVDTDDLLSWARSFGAAGAFAKPFDIKALSATINTIIGR
jgi:DNA-binding NtrC family response regulator